MDMEEHLGGEGAPIQGKWVVREKGDCTKPKVQEKQRQEYFKANSRHHFTNKIFIYL